MEVMHFSFATLRYYPFGGLEKSFLNICREALKRGHKLDIYCTSWEGEKLAGATIHEIPISAWTNHGELQEFHTEVAFVRNDRKEDVFVGFKRMPDLDVYYNGDFCFQAEAARKHGAWYRLTPRYRSMIRFETSVFSRNSATHIMYISEREKEIYQSVYGTQPERFHALPAGIDKHRIRTAHAEGARERMRATMHVDKEQIVIIMVGSDFRLKGVDRALRMLSALPSEHRNRCVLWVVGDGNVQRYSRLAELIGIGAQASFLGGRSDVPDLLCAADILIHPAVRETAGNAIVEGLVAGLPVIVSASAGFSYHVERAKGGIVVDDTPFSQASFDQALLQLMSDSRRRELGANGWSYADKTDLYSRPTAAVDIIEWVARNKVNASLVE
jgi:UDP-glucose:(heptosyl)LPS alpha-1,3-glucosyltransferase